MFKFLKKKKNNKTTENDTSSVQSFAGGQIGGYTAINHANASDAAIEGMNLFNEAADKLLNVSVEIKQGNLFEYIEAAKFNRSSATLGSKIRAHVTASEGAPHSSADIAYREGDKVLGEVQAKSGNNAARLTYKISDPKYEGMQKLVNSDKAERVQELAERRAETGTLKAGDYTDTAKNVTGELSHGNIKSGGTTSDEAFHAAKHSKQYAAKFELQQFGKEVAITGAQAAVAGAIIGGSISVVKHCLADTPGEVEIKQSVREVLSDAGKAGSRGGATGSLGAGIRVTAQKTGVNTLTKSSVSMPLAAGAIDMGATIYSFAKGEISSEQAIEQIGQTGISTMSSIYSGAVAGLAFGPAGAVVGSIAGYMIATNVYQGCVAVFREAELAEIESQRIVSLYNQAIIEMQNQRFSFENALEKRLKLKRKEFEQHFKDIDSALASNNTINTIFALSAFAESLGRKLKLTNFQDFDKHMKSDAPLKF